MTTFGEIQNSPVLISHEERYITPRTISEILCEPISHDLLCLLSLLSFSPHERSRFQAWHSSRQSQALRQVSDTGEDGTVIFGRIQLFECWAQLLMRADKLKLPRRGRPEMAEMLHELFAKINDDETCDDPDHYVARSAIHFSRDDYVHKLYRAQKIFLDGAALAPHVAAFEEMHGFTLEVYLSIVFSVVSRCHELREVDSFNPESIDRWAIDLRALSQGLKVDIQIASQVFSRISIEVDEACVIAKLGGVASSFRSFRNRPFLKVSEFLFIPIEGRLVEELLFENLQHRLHQASGVGVSFYQDFGRDFENYVQHIIERFCSVAGRGGYEYIQEFAYGKSDSRSPDAMVKCNSDGTVIAFEAKSARYLDRILTESNGQVDVTESFNKLRFKPWEQVHKSIVRIVGESQDHRLTDGLKYLFVAVTMNEIPHSLQDYKIDVNGLDRSYCFYSFGIHSLELLLAAGSASMEFKLYDILRNAFAQRHKISNRTAFLRHWRSVVEPSRFDLDVRMEAIRRVSQDAGTH